jgi:hypothetical protein
LRVALPGRLAPGEVIEADWERLSDTVRAASLAGVPVAVWLAQGPPRDAPGGWRLMSIRGFVQSRLGRRREEE